MDRACGWACAVLAGEACAGGDGEWWGSDGDCESPQGDSRSGQGAERGKEGGNDWVWWRGWARFFRSVAVAMSGARFTLTGFCIAHVRSSSSGSTCVSMFLRPMFPSAAEEWSAQAAAGRPQRAGMGACRVAWPDSDVLLPVGIRVQTRALDSWMQQQARVRAPKQLLLGFDIVCDSKANETSPRGSTPARSPSVKTRRQSPPASSTPSCLLAFIFLLAFHLIPRLVLPALAHPPRFCRSHCFVHSRTKWIPTLCPFPVCLVSRTM